MPHFIVEHSANLTRTHDMQKLADEISAVSAASGVFPLAGIRVRMHPVQVYAMADGHRNNAFVAIVMRVGAGRTTQTLQQCGREIYEAVCNFFAAEIEAGFMAISVDMEINDPDLSFKRNGVADRLKSA